MNVVEKINLILKQANIGNYTEAELKELEISNNNYLIVYDYIKQDYVVYDKDVLLNNINIEDNNERIIRPENNKIEENIDLYNFYNNSQKGKTQKIINVNQ